MTTIRTVIGALRYGAHQSSTPTWRYWAHAALTAEIHVDADGATVDLYDAVNPSPPFAGVPSTGGETPVDGDLDPATALVRDIRVADRATVERWLAGNHPDPVVEFANNEWRVAAPLWRPAFDQLELTS